MWELDCEESWALKNWCFWTVVLEKTLESPLDCKEIQPVHSKGNRSWVFFGKNDAKAETPVFWPPHVKSWLIGKRLWCWEGLEAGREGDDRGWDGWIARQWTGVWASSRRWLRTGKPGMLQSLGSQTVRHDWGTEQQHIQHFGKHWSGLISHFKMCKKPHSTAVLSSEGRTMVGRDYCCWAEWGLRQQLCKVSSVAASLGRTSKDYNRIILGAVNPWSPTILGLSIV